LGFASVENVRREDGSFSPEPENFLHLLLHEIERRLNDFSTPSRKVDAKKTTIEMRVRLTAPSFQTPPPSPLPIPPTSSSNQPSTNKIKPAQEPSRPPISVDLPFLIDERQARRRASRV
jgi:hypothetical protein